MLCGPPGVGKTHSVRCAAADVGAFLVPIAGMEGEVANRGGEMAMALRSAFERAKRRVESRWCHYYTSHFLFPYVNVTCITSPYI